MSTFRIVVCSDIEYEDLVAEIYYDDHFVGLIAQEDGFDALTLSLHPDNPPGGLRFRVAEFEAVISQAKQRLWDLRRT